MMFSRPLALWMALVAMTGCVSTHSPDDASGVDAAMPPDAVHGTDALLPVDAVEVPDAFVSPDAFCPDSDRDGERDIRCGGTDCDDADAQLSSTRVRCASPVSVTRCDGAMRVDSSCGGDTPYCDARTGACVADACGDRVVHSNEQCDSDDFAMCVECHQACRSSADCPMSMVCNPGFAPMGEFSFSGCVPANVGGAPFGARCTANSDCYTNVCSPFDGRCTETAAALETAMCTGPHRWSQHVPIARNGEGGGAFIATSSLCAFECEHDSECAPRATCIPMVLNVGYFVAGCRNGWARGTVAQGETCAMEHDCASGVCVFGRCSRLCRDAADCDPGAPNCVATDRSMPPLGSSDGWAGRPRPAEWGTPFPRVCLP